jgi:hypothetical protein
MLVPLPLAMFLFASEAWSAEVGTEASAPAANRSVTAILQKSGDPIDARVSSGANPQLAEPVLRKLDRMQPLPPQYRDLHDQPVPNSEALIGALGLPNQPRRTTDLTGRTPSRQDIVDGLK